MKFMSAATQVYGARWRVTICTGGLDQVYEMHWFDNAWHVFRRAVRSGALRAEIEPIR